MTLSVADRNRLDELTNFYRHLNMVVENIIDKFSTMERVTSKFMKAQPPAGQPFTYTPGTPIKLQQETELGSQGANRIDYRAMVGGGA